MRRTQHPTNNAVLGAPSGMTRDECGALPITRFEYADGTQAVASYWAPSEEEIARMQDGKPVVLLTLGVTTPPVLILVDGDEGLPA